MKDVAKQLQSKLHQSGYPVPVLDPIVSSIKVAKILAELKISHSKRVHVTPEARKVIGYDTPVMSKFW